MCEKVSVLLGVLNACSNSRHFYSHFLCIPGVKYLCLCLLLSLSPPTVSGLTILNERTAQCQSALGKLQRGRKAKPSMRLSTCLIHTKERALKHKSLLVSISVLSRPSIHCYNVHPLYWKFAFPSFYPGY